MGNSDLVRVSEPLKAATVRDTLEKEPFTGGRSLIETLELIPEPDGSPTEDFVIPEGFRERQQR